LRTELANLSAFVQNAIGNLHVELQQRIENIPQPEPFDATAIHSELGELRTRSKNLESQIVTFVPKVEFDQHKFQLAESQESLSERLVKLEEK
jgi:hypothetical protein